MHVFAVRANHAFDGEDFRAGGATVLVQDGGIVGASGGDEAEQPKTAAPAAPAMRAVLARNPIWCSMCGPRPTVPRGPRTSCRAERSRPPGGELRRGAALPRAASTPVVHMIGRPALLSGHAGLPSLG